MNIWKLAGLAILPIGIWAVRFIRRSFRSGGFGLPWIFVAVGFMIAGVVLGAVAGVHSSYPDPDTRLLGFPFVAAEFERSPTGGWVDFLGPRTLPAMLGNFSIGMLLPQVLFAGVLWSSAQIRLCKTKNST
jgi:hypothetical protein